MATSFPGGIITNTIFDTNDSTKNLSLDFSSSTADTSAVLSFSQTSNITISLPNVSTTLVGSNIPLNSNGIVGVNSGGDSLTSTTLTNGQLLVGNTGNSPSVTTLNGTTNQISVVNGAGTITLSTPQDINTSSKPTFGSVIIGTSHTLTGTNTLIVGNGNVVTGNVCSVLGQSNAMTGTDSSFTDNIQIGKLNSLVVGATTNVLDNIQLGTSHKFSTSQANTWSNVQIGSFSDMTSEGTNSQFAITINAFQPSVSSTFWSTGGYCRNLAGTSGLNIHGANIYIGADPGGGVNFVDVCPSTVVSPTSGPNLTNQTYVNSGTATLTNKSMSGSSNTFTNIPNSALVNSSITVNPGTGLTGGGSVSLGGSVTLSLITPVGISDGGTGSTSLTTNGIISVNGSAFTSNVLTDGQLLIGRTGLSPLSSTLTGTSNRVSVTNGAGSITLSTPQDIAISSSPTFASETLTNTTNQLILGTTNTTTISSLAPSGSRIYTISDAGGNDTFTMNDATQSLTNKTLDSTTNTIAADKLHSATTSITISSATAPTSGQVLTATSSTSADWQTPSSGGVTTFSAGTTGLTPSSPTSGAITLGGILSISNGGTNTNSLAANGIISVDNDGLALTSNILTDGQILIGNTSNIPTAATLTGTTNRISVTNGAGSITLSTPQDINTSSSPTFVSETLTNTTNQLVLGTTNTTTINSVAPLSSRIYTISDAGGNDTFTMNSATQTLTNKTLDSTTNVITADKLHSATTTITISSATAPSSGQVLTATSSTSADWQTPASGGVTTFSAGTTGFLPNSATSGAVTLSGILSIPNGGTNTNSLAADGIITVDNDGLALTSNILTDGQLLIGNTGGPPIISTLTGTLNRVNVTNGAGTITLSLPQDIATSSSPTFASETLTNTTNQLILGTTNTTTISSVTPSASRIYTISDAGANDTFTMNAATQTLTNKSLNAGSVFFVDNTTPSKRIGFQSSGATASTTLTLAGNQTTNRTITFPDATDIVVTLAESQFLTNKSLSTGSTTYNTGTASQSTTTITGVGTAFSASMVGGVLIYANRTQAFITAFVSTTQLTASPSQTVTSQAFIIYYSGLQIDNVGNLSSNKLTYFNATNTTFNDPTDQSKRIRTQISGATTNTTLTLAGIQTVNRTITFPDVTDTVVTLTATQTLTNKSISGSTNTLSNIPNSALTNSSLTVTAGTGLSGGGVVSLGGSVTLNLATPVTLANGGTNTTSLTANGIITSTGTALSSNVLTNGQLLIGRTGLSPLTATLTGTTNQINITNGSGSITLSTPQDINTTATPTFGSLRCGASLTYSGTNSLMVGGKNTLTGSYCLVSGILNILTGTDPTFTTNTQIGDSNNIAVAATTNVFDNTQIGTSHTMSSVQADTWSNVQIGAFSDITSEATNSQFAVMINGYQPAVGSTFRSAAGNCRNLAGTTGVNIHGGNIYIGADPGGVVSFVDVCPSTSVAPTTGNNLVNKTYSDSGTQTLTNKTISGLTNTLTNIPAGGSNTQVQYNNSGVLAGASKLSVTSDGCANLGVFTTTDPVTPATGNTIFSRNRATRNMVTQIAPTGVSFALQPALFTNKIGWWTANGNGTVVAVINITNSVTGTATARSVATTNLFTSMRRIGYVSTTTAGTSAGTRHNALQFWRGNASGLGGFFYVARFGISSAATVATQRTFVGFTSAATVIGNVDPSSLNNILGFGADSADANFSFMHSAVGVTTKETLSASFPARTLSTNFMEIRIYCPPNGTTIGYSIENLSTGAFLEGSVTTNIPSNTTLLSPQIWTNNGTTALACGIDISSQYIETDN